MNALLLSRYERSGASSRLRLIQYQRYLAANGIQSSLAPFFDESYLERLYSGGSKLGPTISAYMRRVHQLINARKNDFLWLEKEALLWMPWRIENAFLPNRVPIAIDYDDAVFHRYDMHRSVVVQKILGKKLDRLMSSATLVTAGNEYLARRAREAGASWVEIVPTVVDMDAYTLRDEHHFGVSSTIGWIGTPSTWTDYMAPMMSLLAQAAQNAGSRITAVGAGRAAENHPLLDVLPWSEESEVALIQNMGIGIMPLTDTPWSRGKCGYKLIQYMACGVPVIASPVGVNVEIVDHGVNGFLATTQAEWREAIGTLLQNPDLRKKMGQAGRKKIEAEYSLQVWGPRVANLLKTAAKRGKEK